MLTKFNKEEIEKAKRYIKQNKEEFNKLLQEKKLIEVHPFKFNNIIQCIMLAQHYKLYKIEGYEVIFNNKNNFHTIILK